MPGFPLSEPLSSMRDFVAIRLPRPSGAALKAAMVELAPCWRMTLLATSATPAAPEAMWAAPSVFVQSGFSLSFK